MTYLLGSIDQAHAREWEDEEVILNVLSASGTGKIILRDHQSPDEDFHADWFGSPRENLRQSLGKKLADWHFYEFPRKESTGSAESLRQRLANANDYFRRKAVEVLNDEASLDLLLALHGEVVVDISSFDACENGIPLSKLTAANFCEVGAKVIYITEAGQLFVDSLMTNGRI